MNKKLAKVLAVADFESRLANWSTWSANGNPSVVYAGTNNITGVAALNGSQYYASVFDTVGTAGKMYRTISGLQPGATYKTNTSLELDLLGEAGSAWSYANFDNLEILKT